VDKNPFLVNNEASISFEAFLMICEVSHSDEKKETSWAKNEIAYEIENLNEDEHSAAMSIIDATETANPDHIKALIHDLVDRLFMDAGVAHERTSKRGERYSIADETYRECAGWFDYPWD
jgi:hypothetical protein